MIGSLPLYVPTQRRPYQVRLPMHVVLRNTPQPNNVTWPLTMITSPLSPSPPSRTRHPKYQLNRIPAFRTGCFSWKQKLWHWSGHKVTAADIFFKILRRDWIMKFGINCFQEPQFFFVLPSPTKYEQNQKISCPGDTENWIQWYNPMSDF